jgi:hypothetical protein
MKIQWQVSSGNLYFVATPHQMSSAEFWTDPLNEHCEKIGTYEVYQVKCNLVNGLPSRYRGESDWA